MRALAAVDFARDGRAGFDLGELRADGLKLARMGLTIVAFVLVAVVAPGVNEARGPVVIVAAGLLALAAGVHVALDRSIALATLLLVGGLVVILAVGQRFLFPGMPLVVALPLVVVLAGSLGGSVTGAVVATTASGIVLITYQQGDGLLSSELAILTIGLVWAGAFVSWLTTRPIYTTLDWAWHSYQQAEELVVQLRRRQEELGRLSKSLNESCEHLERLNVKLRQAREAAEEARRLKAEFAAAVSHELRTPLNLIIGFSELMVLPRGDGRPVGPPDPYRGDIEAIYRNACHLSNLVDDVLDLSQVDAHRMALQREQTHLAEVIREAMAAVTSMFEEKGLPIFLALPEGLPPLRIDRLRVRQVLSTCWATPLASLKRAGSTSSPARMSARSWSRWPTPASASPPAICPGSSRRSTGRTRPDGGATAGSD
ncbi:MAG: HAMP domain-containing histidine kinase [Chloroflexi bacterium]|nr:HAMP domain-containing histidine kinase [Chloroflexota bacterium]